MRLATVAVWSATLLSLLVGGLIAVEFGFMASSLDPTDLLVSGTAPWTDALIAVGAFLGLLVAGALGLRLWHSRRFRVLGLILVLAEVAGTAWACATVYAEYF